MPEVPPPSVPTQLIVFADDWGRHPSSSQHLIRELLPHYPTLWVNTVGTRRPRLTWEDAKRVAGRLKVIYQKATSSFHRASARIIQEATENLTVASPLMYPGFRSPWQRRFNARQIAKVIATHRMPGHRVVVITTLPITADVVELARADRWVYYCVDDYSEWPGTDSEVMMQMEAKLLSEVDAVAAVSEALSQRIGEQGRRDATRVTHGVDLALWDGSTRQDWNAGLDPNHPDDDPWWWYEPPQWVEDWEGRAVALFWGLIDRRMELSWLEALRDSSSVDRVALVGPTNAAPHELASLAEMPGEANLSQLPAIAEAASVLIMPYIDAPVTRAMQPLKLKEYLATMKPVVVRDLPSTRQWADCCDVASTADEFVRLVQERVRTGTPPEQIAARKRRLANESWTDKAIQLAELINAS